MSDSEKRAAALRMQIETKRMFERFKARLAHIKDRPTPPFETDTRRRLWWETLLVGGGGGIATMAALRSTRVGRLLSAVGGVVNAQVVGAVWFGSRAPGYFEDIVRQPERSPFVDDALCPTLLDFQKIARHPDFSPALEAPDGASPPASPLVQRMWSLCADRAGRFQAADDEAAGDARWGRPAGASDGFADAGFPAGGDAAQEWYTPPSEPAWGDDAPKTDTPPR